jgi:hypothetical protein
MVRESINILLTAGLMFPANILKEFLKRKIGVSHTLVELFPFGGAANVLTSLLW